MTSWMLKEVMGGTVGPPIMLNLNQNYVFGRKVGAFIRLDSAYASRRHCTITIKNNYAFIMDHKTLNGTYIGPDKVPSEREIPLKSGDHIGIGLAPSEFTFEPYYIISKSEVDPEILEIQDTCEVDATLPYIVDKAPTAKKTDKDCFLEPGYFLRKDDDVFRIPAPVSKSLSLSRVKRESLSSNLGSPKSKNSLTKSFPLENQNYSLPNQKLPVTVPKVQSDKEFIKQVIMPDHQSINLDAVSNNSIIGPSPESSPERAGSICDNKKEFSMCDDIIIINSDDDEDDLPCSQFFNSSKREKESEDLLEESLCSFHEPDDAEPLKEHAQCDLSDEQEIEFFEAEAHNLSKMFDKEFDEMEQVENHENDKPLVENQGPQNELSIHSQLSPETYLSRVNNENDIEANEPMTGYENLLEALMTQKECEVNVFNLREFAEPLIDTKEVFTSSKTEEKMTSPPEHLKSCSTPSTSSIDKVETLKPHKCPLPVVSRENDSASTHKTKHTSKRRNDLCSDVDEPKNKTSRISKHISTPDKKRSPRSELKSEKSSKRNSNTRDNQIKRIIEAGKKLNSSISSQKHTKKAVKEPYNLRPSEKRKIRDLRKKKLQEVALKEKSHKHPETPPSDNNKEAQGSESGKSFVKITDKNRGAILIDMIPQKSNSRVRSKDKETTNKEENTKENEDNKVVEQLKKTRSRSKDANLGNTKENRKYENSEEPKVLEDLGKINRRTSLRNLNKNNEHAQTTNELKNDEIMKNRGVGITANRKSILKTRDSFGSSKKVKFASKDQLALVKYYEKDDPEVNKDTHTNSRRTVYVKGSPKTVDSLIYMFCKWNPKWIEESMHTEGIPPLLENKSSPVVTSYESYHEYQNTLLPLHVFELWETIVRDTSQKRQSVCVGGVRSSNESRDKMMEAIFVTSYTRDGDSMPKMGDLVIVKGIDKSRGVGHNAISKQASKANMWLSFGYISTQPLRKPLQHSDKASLDTYRALCASGEFNQGKAGQIYTVSFQVLVRAKTIKFWKAGIEISIATCVNLLQHLTLFMTLERLIFSPLAPLILNPSLFQPIEKVTGFPFKQQQSLNPEQQNAVNYCTRMVLGSQPSVALIHGPPGTGKSVVITHLLMTILDELRKDKHRMRLLVCAPSNFAIDQLVSRLLFIRQKLDKGKFNMVRVGNNEMMSDEAKLISLKTLSEKMLEQFSNPELAKAEIEKLGKREKYLKSLLDCGSDKQQNLNNEINETKRYIRELQQLSERKADKGVRESLLRRYERDVLLKSDIIATTLSSSVSKTIKQNLSSRESRPFGFCVVDEATQASELQCLIPILLNVDKFVLVGDDKQLSPVVTSQKAKADGLELSLFERLLKCWMDGRSLPDKAPVFHLLRQYRMHPEIASFPNKSFYSGTLKSERPHHKVKCRLTPYLVFNHVFHQESDGNSNIEEGEFVLKLINALKGLKETKGLSIAIITPYQAQREFFIRKLRSNDKMKDVNVMTVDSAQGQERDIIVFSCVKSHNIGFMSDSHRLNVALTRAKHALYVVANFSSLKENHVWKELLNDAYSRKLVFEMKKIPSISTIESQIFKTSKAR